MIWLQEYGQKAGANRIDYKMFYCEADADVSYLPTLTASGDKSQFVASTFSEGDDDPVKVGDQVLIWGTGDLKTMMPTNAWKSVGE